MKYAPVIVVVAYNRPHSLTRLLTSLRSAIITSEVKLIISIDNKEPENYPVREIAEAFEWPFGGKQVIYQPTQLGLRKHILLCGDLTEQYGAVIILEDDLFVSPHFYDYAVQALEFYDEEDRISGISLYSQPISDIIDKPFVSVSDDADVFFIQFPSSWGQAWTAKQWKPFREWLEHHHDLTDMPIHRHIVSWSAASWKKYFVAYLASTQKYFVFPRQSHTTNFNDPGTHKILDINLDGQAQLSLSGKQYRFQRPADSFCLYDSHFELLPDSIRKFSKRLTSYDFETDLYGTKDLSRITKPYIITSRPVSRYIHGFARALKPHDMNLLLDLQGEELFLCRKEDVLPVKNKAKRELADYKYFYSSLIIGKKACIIEYLSGNRLFSWLFK